MVFCPQ